MSDNTNPQAVPSPLRQAEDAPAERRPYVPPSLVDYGDIATVTQTAKGSAPDGLNKKFRTG